MKHIFIINPVAGGGNRQKKLVEELKERQLDFYQTKGIGDGEQYVRTLCEQRDEALRFYACGGDGTLNEVVNGLAGFSHAEAACIPMGSGNDFVRNFDHPFEHFRDIDRQIAGCAQLMDLICYEGMKATVPVKRYGVNMFNIGFDCDVVDQMARMKKKSVVKGPPAYWLSIGLVFLKKRAVKLSVSFDDKTEYNGKVFFLTMANGCFCGGGLKGMPRALTDDGLMDICLVRNVSRRAMIPVFPRYVKGTYLSYKKANKILMYKQCKELTVKPSGGFLKLCVDGEIDFFGDVRFEIVQGGFRFSLPQR